MNLDWVVENMKIKKYMYICTKLGKIFSKIFTELPEVGELEFVQVTTTTKIKKIQLLLSTHVQQGM